MFTAHFVLGGYIKLVSVALNGEGVRRRRAFGAERKELFYAATYACALRGEEQISAVWANIEPKLFNISAACGFFLKVAAQYCFCIERKHLRKGGNKENIGYAAPPFLFAHRLIRNAYFFAKLALGKILPQAGGADYFSGLYLIHKYHFLIPIF